MKKDATVYCGISRDGIFCPFRWLKTVLIFATNLISFMYYL
jgi:hypothetical protein